MRDHGLTGGPPPVETRAEPMADIAFRSREAAGRRHPRKKIGCLELLDLYLARVEKHDPALNAIVVRDVDARAQARARRRPRAGEAASVGPAARRADDGEGVVRRRRPADDVGRAGASRTTSPTTNAVVVDRLLAAGAVIFGKTNVPL